MSALGFMLLIAVTLATPSISFAGMSQAMIGAQRNQCLELASTWTPSYANIVGYWKLNGTTASALATGSSITATIGPNGTTAASAALQRVASNIDQGLNFDGVGHVTFGNVAALKPALPVSFAFKIKVNTLPVNGNEGAIWSSDTWAFGGIGRYSGIIVNTLSTGTGFKLAMSYGDNGGDGSAYRRTFTSSPAYATATWYHVVVVLQGATNMQLYVNGAAVAGNYNGTGGALTYSSGSSQLGFYTNSISTGAEKLKGVLDDFAIWNVALSAGDAATLYANQQGCP